MKLAAALLCSAAAAVGVGAWDWKADVASKSGDVARIVAEAVDGDSAGLTFERLAEMTDRFGHRLSGSESLEQSIDWLEAQLLEEGGFEVHTEDVQVPSWHRGAESAWMREPRNYQMSILGLGGSVATPAEGITAEVLLVETFDELKNKSAEAKGKIVVFNPQCDWKAKPTACYGETVTYRGGSASAAARVGAVAALVRSLTGFSLDTPHTGLMSYDEDADKIPTASLTVEDTEAIARMQARGDKVIIELHMEATNLPMATSRNLIVDWRGSEKPDEVVLISGHIDSWDVGVGAMDDGGGAFIGWTALSVLKKLNLRPKRTVRQVFWTCEEFGGYGGNAYWDAHKANVSKFSAVFESDMGNFLPTGMQFKGSSAAEAVMAQVVAPLAVIGAGNLTKGGGGEDINNWMVNGVPGGSPKTNNEAYFDFHHTHADRMGEAVTTGNLDLNVAVWASVAYSVADLDELLPRNDAGAFETMTIEAK